MRDPRENGREMAHAFWLRKPGHGEIRPVRLPEPGRNDVVVRTVRTGISRGTEMLVYRGGVPPHQYAAMRAPFQEGDFPGPLKYGYLSVGAVEQGPPELRGRTVFCLYPHQTAYVVPSAAVCVVPEDVPPGRAVLAGIVETAVNALWDAAPLIGDRVAVVGAGRPRPGRPYQCDVRRPPAVARPARARGHRHRPQLVWRRGGPALAGRVVPRRSPGHPLEPGRHRLARPQHAPHDGRTAGSRRRPAA